MIENLRYCNTCFNNIFMVNFSHEYISDYNTVFIHDDILADLSEIFLNKKWINSQPINWSI